MNQNFSMATQLSLTQRVARQFAEEFPKLAPYVFFPELSPEDDDHTHAENIDSKAALISNVYTDNGFS